MESDAASNKLARQLSLYQDGVRRIQRAVLEDGCPGLLTGLSGTDSGLAFKMAYDALKPLGMADRLCGVYYGRRDKDTGLPIQPRMRALYEWIREEMPEAYLDVSDLIEQKLPNDDYERWADIRRRTLVVPGTHGSWEPGEHFWAVTPRNRTEVILGNFSLDSAAASLSPIEELYKSDVLALCAHFGLPEKVIEGSRLPDCLCGREELASSNIELIDDILDADLSGRYLDLSGHDPHLIEQLYAHIHEKKLNNAHKMRFSGKHEGETRAPHEYNPVIFDQPHAKTWMPEAMVALPRLPAFEQGQHLRLMFGMAAGLDNAFAGDLIRCCQLAASLGFSFPVWRFLSMGLGEQPLLEQMGMQRLRRDTDTLDASLKDPHRDLYGPGFVHEDDELYIEYRRAYVAVHLKAEDFSLLVRNNSPYFGRDRLPSPVLYASGLSVEALKNLSPRNLAQGGVWTPFERVISDRSETGTARTLALVHKALDSAFAFDARVSEWLSAPQNNAALNAFLARRDAAMPQPLYAGLIDAYAPPWHPKGVIEITHGVDPSMMPSPQDGARTVLLNSPTGDRPYKLG